MADPLSAEVVDNVETNQLVVAESEDKNVEEDEKQGDLASIELEVKVSIEGVAKKKGLSMQ